MADYALEGEHFSSFSVKRSSHSFSESSSILRFCLRLYFEDFAIIISWMTRSETFNFLAASALEINFFAIIVPPKLSILLMSVLHCKVYLDKDALFSRVCLYGQDNYFTTVSRPAGIRVCIFRISNAYPHLKKIRIAAFDNQSSEFALGEKTLNMLSAAFRDDGRLRPVTQAPDCVLEGSIISFEEKIYSFDSANNVQDYQIRISFKVSLTDLINNQTIYENNALVLSELYAVSTESTSKNKKPGRCHR